MSVRTTITRRRISGAAILVAALAAAGLPGQASAEEVEVRIDNFTFAPQQLTVQVGTTVTWTNEDDIPHNIVSSARGAFKSKVMDTEGKYSFTFTNPGSFEYFCALHPHMKGTIVVEGTPGPKAP